MTSISEAILFVASNSVESGKCLQFITQQRIPMNVVRLDTAEARRTAANGKFFQIVNVPTMVIVYEDGNTQLFLGTPKIVQWINAARTSATKRQSDPRTNIPSQPNMYGPISTLYPTPRRSNGDRGGSAQELQELPFEDDPPEEHEYSEEDEFQEPSRRSYKKPTVVVDNYPSDDSSGEGERVARGASTASTVKRGGTKKGKSKSKPKSRKPKVEDDEPQEVKAKRNLAKEKLNHAASSKSAPLKSKMKDIYNTAKRMEEDRQDSLGYKEEDLPHY